MDASNLGSYQARLFGRGMLDVRGGKRALLRALEKSLEQLQSTRVDLYQVRASCCRSALLGVDNGTLTCPLVPPY